MQVHLHLHSVSSSQLTMEMKGQLTSLGSHRMYDLGSELRKVYVDELGFLPKHLDSNIKISHTYIW